MISTLIALALAMVGLTGPTSDDWGDAPELPNSVYDAFYTCAPVPLDGLSQSAVVYLTASGWVGDPADGMEALYGPRC